MRRAADVRRPGILEGTPFIVLLVLVAGAAWLWTAVEARGMGSMPGTMGMGFASFLLMWTLMMVAMMLWSAAPMASMYAGSVTHDRLPRLTLFAFGYLLVWSMSGIPAYTLAWIAGEAADRTSVVGVGLAAGIFAACGIYQLSSAKYRCLSHCRSPISQLLEYTGYRGLFRDLRAGLRHGTFCLACCWALMTLMAAFGVMNLWAMIGLSAVVALEKLLPRGDWFARGVGIAAFAAAVGVFFVPDLAPGLTAGPTDMGADMEMLTQGK